MTEKFTCRCGDYVIGPTVYVEGWQDGHMMACAETTPQDYLDLLNRRALKPTKRKHGSGGRPSAPKSDRDALREARLADLKAKALGNEGGGKA